MSTQHCRVMILHVRLFPTLPTTLLQAKCVKCQVCTPVCVCCNLCDILQCQAQPSVNIPAADIHRKNAFIVTTEIKVEDINRCTKDKHYLTIMKDTEVIYYTSYNPHYNVVTGHSKQHLLTKSICINLYRTCKKYSVIQNMTYLRENFNKKARVGRRVSQR